MLDRLFGLFKKPKDKDTQKYLFFLRKFDPSLADTIKLNLSQKPVVDYDLEELVNLIKKILASSPDLNISMDSCSELVELQQAFGISEPDPHIDIGRSILLLRSILKKSKGKENSDVKKSLNHYKLSQMKWLYEQTWTESEEDIFLNIFKKHLFPLFPTEQELTFKQMSLKSTKLISRVGPALMLEPLLAAQIGQVAEMPCWHLPSSWPIRTSLICFGFLYGLLRCGFQFIKNPAESLMYFLFYLFFIPLLSLSFKNHLIVFVFLTLSYAIFGTFLTFMNDPFRTPFSESTTVDINLAFFIGLYQILMMGGSILNRQSIFWTEKKLLQQIQKFFPNWIVDQKNKEGIEAAFHLVGWLVYQNTYELNFLKNLLGKEYIDEKIKMLYLFRGLSHKLKEVVKGDVTKVALDISSAQLETSIENKTLSARVDMSLKLDPSTLNGDCGEFEGSWVEEERFTDLKSSSAVPSLSISSSYQGFIPRFRYCLSANTFFHPDDPDWGHHQQPKHQEKAQLQTLKM